MNSPLTAQAVSAEPLRLNLGGRDTKIEGFKTVDMQDGSDIQTDVSDLKMIADNSVEEIYASHILEHFSHRRTVGVLKEWRRVLKPQGKIYISVPDLDALVPVIRERGLVDYVRNMLYGDQIYDLAFHYTIFTFPSLAKACNEAGYSDIKRIQSMPYGIQDCSKNVDTIFARPVSVNAKAVK